MKQSDKKSIQERNRRNEFYLRIMYGAKEIIKHKWKILFPVFYLLVLALVFKKSYYFCNQQNKLFAYLWNIVRFALPFLFVVLTSLGVSQILVILGTPWGTKRIQQNFLRIKFTNDTGEIPLLLSKHKNNKIVILEFYNCGIPLAEWDNKRDKLGAILNCNIIKAELGKNSKFIRLYTISETDNFPQRIEWRDEYLLADQFSLILGTSYLGKVTVDLRKSPHILLGGSTGSGKSLLLKVLLMQCIRKNHIIYIADFKGGVDYPPVWHDKCYMIYYENEMLAILSQITDTLEKRKELFRNAGCPDIDSYNSQTGNHLSRIIFACDELAEVLDKTGLSKERKEQISAIESQLSIIARLGRAFGIHLILATQRPSADILSGQIKNNIDFRVCGKADSILSQIILDNTDAATKIPKNSQGQFITNTGELFQGYWFDDRKLE